MILFRRNAPALFAFSIIALAISAFSIDLGDFQCFYSASRAVPDPYSVNGFFSPLHVLIYYAPLSILPYRIAYNVNAFLCALALLWLFWRMSNHHWPIMLVLCLSPWLLYTTWYGQIEWLVMLGLFAPAPVGILLLLLKPQIGWLPALIIWLGLWRVNRRAAVLVAVLAVAIFGVSYLAGMRWGAAINAEWNTSIFPLSAILAAPIVVYAIVKRRTDIALSSALCFSPYIGPASWIVLSAWWSKSIWLALVFDALSWAIVLSWRSQ